jgi:GGDEF domain-containing protein
MVALWRAFGDRYLQVIDLTKGDHRRLSAIEQRSFETDHALIGGEMVARWRFPDEIACAVRCHHRAFEADPQSAALARTVELAGSAAAVLVQRSGEHELARFRREGQEWFDLRPGPLTLLLQRIADRADELSRAFGLDTGGTPDVDAILRRASEIKREQQLAEPDIGGDACDVVEHGTLSIGSIPDARAFGAELERVFTEHDRIAGIGVLLVGIDRARAMQEAFGPRAVEAAMAHAVAQVRTVAPRARLHRFVGAELALLFPEIEADDLCRAAEIIRKAMATHPVPFDHATARSFPATVSIGAAMYETNTEIRSGTGIGTPDQLVSAAMFALTAARRDRNRVVMFRRELSVGH